MNERVNKGVEAEFQKQNTISKLYCRLISSFSARLMPSYNVLWNYSLVFKEKPQKVEVLGCSQHRKKFAFLYCFCLHPYQYCDQIKFCLPFVRVIQYL